ncbi:MAG: formylglycine-generating enzyme family protein [Bacteroidales bacterium]
MKGIITFLLLSISFGMYVQTDCYDDATKFAEKYYNKGMIAEAKAYIEDNEKPCAGEPSEVFKCIKEKVYSYKEGSLIDRVDRMQEIADPVPKNNFKTYTETVNGVSFKMVAVDGGSFYMGSNDGDDDEKPVHRVSLSDYYIGETEVTQALWETVMGDNPSGIKGSNNPVEWVSWNECREFVDRLNRLTGKSYRLPTEAEWEFAARGGTSSSGYKYSGSDKVSGVAWYRDNGGNKTHPVKGKQSNELGLYDMSGNVSEWCSDWYASDYYSSSSSSNPRGPSSGPSRVVRGGGWSNYAWYCQVAERDSLNPSFSNYRLGLRLASSSNYEASVPANSSTAQKEAERKVAAERAQQAEANHFKTYTETVNGVSFKMIAVDSGSFNMGDNEWGWSKPIHRVSLSDYYICETEVTQALWEAVMGDNPSCFKGSTNPVERVNWNDCQEFVIRLSNLTGRSYRLPTEAEWEFAARGGNSSYGYKFSGSDRASGVAWYEDNSGSKTHPVKGKRSNELGLYDMSGNVWEWCSDWYAFDYYSNSSSSNPRGPSSRPTRVVRGGCWGDYASYGQVANRYGSSQSDSINNVGFRLASSSAIKGFLDNEKEQEKDATAWQQAKDVNIIAGYENYLGSYPSGKHKAEAERALASLKQEAEKMIAAQAETNRFKTFTETVNGVSFKMVAVKGGSFDMGSNDGYAENPVHRVSLSDYYIGETEVTQELWEAVMGDNPSNLSGSNNPVEQVSWDECQEFVRQLSSQTGRTYRMPTEAEWEFAARGGNNSYGYKYSGSDNIGDVAWYGSNCGGKTHPVKGKQSNELGLYDMSGNVSEWCSDWYDSDYYNSSPSSNPKGPSIGSSRVVRGGSKSGSAAYCQVAERHYFFLSHGDYDLGLRLASGSK